MNTKQVDQEFEKLIKERNVHKRLQLASQLVRNYRQYLKDGRGVSIDLKIQLLQRAGIYAQEKTYNRKDLISLLNFYKRTSQAARDMGPEYVIEKWEKGEKFKPTWKLAIGDKET